MRSNPFVSDADYSPNGLSDRKAALVREADERATVRAQKIAAQSSPFASPHQRIELWERLHGLALPRSPAHKLVQVIARQTELAVSDIHDEQVRRASESNMKG